MAAQPVEWVLVVYYGTSAHRATYGRQVRSPRYSKDYIQLSKEKKFLDAVTTLFSVTAGATGSVPLTYQWPTGTTPGAFVFQSSDRPHLKWETRLGAPRAWKMAPYPTDTTAETIPGDPSHLEYVDAENELAALAGRGAGQPYLMAIKLRDEPRTLHLRAYLASPNEDYGWADLELVPPDIQTLAARTSQKSALAWSTFQSGGIIPSAVIESLLSQLGEHENRMSVLDTLDTDTGHALTKYLLSPGHGLFFDPTRNHNAWLQPSPLPLPVAGSVDSLLQLLESRFPAIPGGDAIAETLENDLEEVQAFREQITQRSYEVLDSTATTKTRGSAQRAFAEAVKTNYGYRCAITGVMTKDFLVASHIVPWSKDPSIRLDPSNGICLSLLVDRAFEKGYIQIKDDLTITIDWERVGGDLILRSQLLPFEGQMLRVPTDGSPKAEYLQRRRALVASTD